MDGYLVQWTEIKIILSATKNKTPRDWRETNQSSCWTSCYRERMACRALAHLCCECTHFWTSVASDAQWDFLTLGWFESESGSETARMVAPFQSTWWLFAPVYNGNKPTGCKFCKPQAKFKGFRWCQRFLSPCIVYSPTGNLWNKKEVGKDLRAHDLSESNRWWITSDEFQSCITAVRALLLFPCINKALLAVGLQREATSIPKSTQVHLCAESVWRDWKMQMFRVFLMKIICCTSSEYCLNVTMKLVSNLSLAIVWQSVHTNQNVHAKMTFPLIVQSVKSSFL